MTKRIPYEQLHVSEHSWLKSRFHFSFAEYHNPEKSRFGVLRVMNDDIIAPHSGFEMHPHHDMEIFTYVIEGELTHQDSLGNEEKLVAGDIQYLSAGSGISHSEKNESSSPVHLIQTWILPSQKGLKPQYGSYRFEPSKRHNVWQHLFGPQESSACMHFYQDANVYVSILDKGAKRCFELTEGRQAYVKVMRGEALLNENTLHQGDAAEVSEESLNFEAVDEVHLLVIEMSAIKLYM